MAIGTELERYMLGLINQARAALGLDPLALEQNLNAAALGHSTWMVATNTLSHTGLNNSSGLDRIDASGFDLGTSWGWAENIGTEQINTQAGFYDEIDLIFDRLMDSASHSASILNADYDVVGLGISVGTHSAGALGLVATQNFATSNGTYDLDLAGTSGADVLRGQDGNDHLLGGAGNDLMLGNDGSDVIFTGLGNDSVNAGDGNDVVFGAAGNDFLRGAGGNDILRGDAGNDYLLGDAGEDDLQGGIGSDSLSGGEGDDYLTGDDGFDVLQGGNGDDTLEGGAQADNLFASGGDDLLLGGAGFDRLFGGFGNDTLEGGDGPDALFGNGGADHIYGGNGDDRSYGAGGNDFIRDSQGDDLLEAGAGFDTLDGGVGDDVLYGRFNADRFVFTDAASGFGNDTIGDFAATNIYERIDLSTVGAITDLADLMANHVAQLRGGALITAGTNSTILLENVLVSDLDQTDFVF